MKDLVQEANESFNTFQERYDEVAAEWATPLPEDKQIAFMLSSLREQIYDRILTGTLPKTRRELEIAARRAESSLPAKNTTDTSRSGSNPTARSKNDLKPTSQDNPLSTATQNPFITSVVSGSEATGRRPANYCTICKSEDHVYSDCPTVVCYRYRQKGHLANRVASALAEHRDHSQSSVGNLQGMCVIWRC
jgi:hypothetical protein